MGVGANDNGMLLHTRMVDTAVGGSLEQGSSSEACWEPRRYRHAVSELRALPVQPRQVCLAAAETAASARFDARFSWASRQGTGGVATSVG